VNYKQRAVISSYSDVLKLSSKIRIVHFRKFVSKKLLKMVFEICPRLEKVSFSKYASKRIPIKMVPIIVEIYSARGRPNALRYPDSSIGEQLPCKQRTKFFSILEEDLYES